ncbi:MAG TPA: TolC family protein [Opitutaceae bacterium]|nr:TolC family protein [Opitutaceae bacterium]
MHPLPPIALPAGRSRAHVTYYVTCWSRLARNLEAVVTDYVRNFIRLAPAGAAVVAAWGMCPTLGPAAEPWTLDRALATALQNSPDARIARQRVAGAEAMIDQARSAWYPQLSVQGRYLETNSPMMAFGSILNQRAFNFGLDFNHPGRIDDLNATGTVGYNLYSGGRASAGLAAARGGARAAGQDLRAAQQQLGAEVVKAWFSVHKAREAVGAVEAGVKAFAAAVSVAQARFDAGQMLKADLLSLEVQLAETQENLAAARHGAALAERAFLFALGLDGTGGDVQLAEDDPAPARLAVPDTGDYSQRPELLGLQERVRAAEAMVRAARGGRRPTVNAFASYQYDRGWQLNGAADSWLAGVSVDLNVFDGGQTSGRIRQANAELEQVKEMLRKAVLGIGLEVEQARLAHAEAVERLAVTARAVAQAEESAALSRARFEKGALLAADLIGVEGRLIAARMRRAVAVADERIAVAELRRTLGVPPLVQP